MFVNNKEFKIYDSDDENSIRERISVLLESTIYWTFIEINDNKPLINSNDITAINILDHLKINIQEYNSFKDLESNYNFWIKQKDEDNDKDAITELGKLYIILYIEDLEDDEITMQTKILLENFLMDSGGTNFDWDFIENVINKKTNIINDLKTEINSLKNKVEKKLETFKKTNFEKTDILNINYTPFLVTSIVETLTIKTEKPVLLSHVMNDLSSDNILFVNWNKFYKVNEKLKYMFKNYDYDYENKDNTLLIVFVSYTSSKKTNYIFKEIKITELSPFDFIVDIDTIEEEINILALENILNSKINIISRSNTLIKGEFTIQDQSIHKELFIDEIMNNENFHNMYINERLKVTKNFSKINIYLYSIKTSSVNFSIHNENNNVKIKVKKILANEYIPFFVNLITSLFKQYKDREKMLYDIYKKFIPGITLIDNDKLTNNYDEQQPSTSRSSVTSIVKTNKHRFNIKQNRLSVVEPSLFVSLYTRKCAKPPRILDDDETVPEGYNFIEFPKFNEGGLKTRRYVCDSTGTFKFPGVRKNTLSNNETFKYIPCCYETNQEARLGSPLNVYLSGKTQERKDKYEHVLYKTFRVLPNENKGILPNGLVSIFETETRRGVFVGPNAFIDCVSRCCKLYADDINNEKSRRITLEKIRQKLKPEFCAQENSDMPNYVSWFKNPNLYFEPRRFFKSLENFFKINIYIFEKSIKYVSEYNEQENTLSYTKVLPNEGIMSIPNLPERGVYLDSKRYKRSAYIYVHMGGAVDSLKNPHCEYIKVDKESENKINFKVEKIYRNMLINSHTDRYFKGDENKIQFQYLDSYGRVLKMLTDSGEELKFKEPIEPIGVPIKKLELKPEKNILDEHVSMKRLARIFIEFCMIKYSEKSDLETIESFIENYSVIVNGFTYNSISPNYMLDYYMNIFVKDGKIIFDSLDTKQRIVYSMKIIEKRNGIKRYISRPYIYGYFVNNLDFDDLTLTEDAFKFFAYENKQGLSMNNYIQDLGSYKLVINKNNVIPELNGYFGVFDSLQVLKETINEKTFLISSMYDHYYLFNETQGYEKYNVENGIGRIIIIYRLNSTIYFLGKYSVL